LDLLQIKLLIIDAPAKLGWGINQGTIVLFKEEVRPILE
jgi:hypothetical protein